VPAMMSSPMEGKLQQLTEDATLSGEEVVPMPTIGGGMADGDEELHNAIVAVTARSEARTRQLAQQRRELSRRTERALKRQKQAARAKAKLEESLRYTDYEVGLQSQRRVRMTEDQPVSHRSPASSSSQSHRLPSPTKLPWASSTPLTPLRTPGEELDQKQLVARAFAKVKAADQEMLHEQQRLQGAEDAHKHREYQETQQVYGTRLVQARLQTKAEREEWSEKVKVEAEERRQQEQQNALERQKLANDRLKLQARQERETEAAEQLERRQRLDAQAKMMAAHVRKKAEAERRKMEVQKQIAAERTREKAETIKYEQARERRRIEWLAESRKTKQEALARTAKTEAAHKARTEAEVKARFKSLEIERTKRETEKRAQERKEARKVREAQRRKAEEENRRKRMEMKEQAKALKAVLKDALTTQDEQQGKNLKKSEATVELTKKMRLMEAERERALRERDAGLVAKEAAFQKAKREEVSLPTQSTPSATPWTLAMTSSCSIHPVAASSSRTDHTCSIVLIDHCSQAFQRALQVEAAQRQVAAIFKRNQEKQLKDRLEREAEEKDRFRGIAKEMREKIQEENRRKLEAERQAAQHLKQMKAAQYKADLASHQRREHMKQFKAQGRRNLQETAWREAMAWQAKQTETEAGARADAKRLFFEQRARKQAEDEELRQVRLHSEQTKLLKFEQERAERAVADAAAVDRELKDTARSSPPRSSAGVFNAFASFWGKSPKSSLKDDVARV
jgi:hypothetical protein